MAAGLVFVIGILGAQSGLTDEVTFSIAKQPLAKALKEFALQSGREILFSSAIVDGKDAEALTGWYEPEDALAALLAKSGLGFTVTEGETFLVTEAREDEAQQAGDSSRVGDEPASERPVQEEETSIELGTQTVTGSRLVRGDPTAQVIVLTAQDIAARGVSNFEEFFRTLPWNYPSITTQTTAQPAGFASADAGDFYFGALGLGISTINLRAMGSRNTLVLVNGRRVAGVAGHEANIVNLLNVPLSAIARVEIQLDGGSAAYGSDAIGGLVNFITKKDYQGLSVNYRQEFSSTGSHRAIFDLNAGYAWDSGSFTGILGRDRSKAIKNRKIWTTSDYREQFGPEYDLRWYRAGQPGVVCKFNGNYRHPLCTEGFVNYWRLPEDHNGVGATPEDFVPFLSRWPWVTDYVYPANGEDATRDYLSLRVDQYITDELLLYGEALISDNDSFRHGRSEMHDYIIPASNAYNPFGETVLVSYMPVRELESGLIPYGYTEVESKHRNFRVGFVWPFGTGHELAFQVTRSESERLSALLRPDFRRSIDDPSAEKFYAAIESSDPDVALNLFGNGTAQNPAFAELFTHPLGRERGYTTVTTYEPVARGDLFRIWGGPVTYAVGAEFREQVYEVSSETYRNKEFVHEYGKEAFLGIERPEDRNTAYFGEFAFPIVGPGNARTGLRSLVLSYQARRDTYEAVGATGGLSYAQEPAVRHYYVPGEGWRAEDYLDWVTVGTPVLTEDSKSKNNQRLGLRYKPVGDLAVFASWSESFQPPSYTVRFDPYGDRLWLTSSFVDPYHPDGDNESLRYPIWEIGYNPSLRSETGNTYSLGFDWTPDAIPGLRWRVMWSRVEFKNKIERADSMLYDHPRIGFAMPELVERNEDGYITRIKWNSVNISREVSETVEGQFEFEFGTRLGRFTPGLGYTRVLEEYIHLPGVPERSTDLGKGSASNRYRILGSLNWQWRRFEADMFAHYTPKYESVVNGRCLRLVGSCEYFFAPLPPVQAKSLTTVDLTVTYRVNAKLRLRGGGRNIFYAKPHVIWYGYPYDPTRWDARGRVLFLEVRWEM